MINTIGLNIVEQFRFHRSLEKLISDCWDKADRAVETGFDDVPVALLFIFDDGTCVEVSPLDSRVSYFADFNEASRVAA